MGAATDAREASSRSRQYAYRLGVDRHPLTSRYAIIELERRFLVSELPPNAVRPIRISDRFIRGTSLRLRKMEDLDETAGPIFKLAQKFRLDQGDPTRVMLTNIYVERFEYELLAGLPADPLRKIRYSVDIGKRFVGVDVFDGPLEGLVMMEADFGSEEEMDSFVPPSFAEKEVSRDDRFSGGRLALTSAEELRALLSSR